MQPELSERVATVLELGSRDICLACVKIGIVSHWKVAVISYSNSSMQPELSERAASVADSGSTVVLYFRSFPLCMHSICVENFQTNTHIGLLPWLIALFERIIETLQKLTMSTKLLILVNFQGISHSLAAAPKMSKAWKPLCCCASSVRLLASGKTVYSWLMDRSCGSMNGCVCWRHQELFVLISAQALR